MTENCRPHSICNDAAGQSAVRNLLRNKKHSALWHANATQLQNRRMRISTAYPSAALVHQLNIRECVLALED